MQKHHAYSPETHIAANRKDTAYAGKAALLIEALLLVGFFLLIIFAARSYLSVTSVQEQNGRMREQLAYLSSVVRGADAKGQIAVKEEEQGDMLEITENGYALRVYQRGDRLLEEYGPAENAPDESRAETIGKTEQFAVSLRNGVLTVCTDEGQIVLHLRSQSSP